MIITHFFFINENKKKVVVNLTRTLSNKEKFELGEKRKLAPETTLKYTRLSSVKKQ